MRDFIVSCVLAVVVVFSAMISMAYADDRGIVVEMPRNAKVGHTEMRVELERLADGDVWESQVTCVKVSQRITKCVSTDDLGWAETIICKGGKCNIVASR